MADIPRAVLSEHFQDRLKGQRVIAGLFLTFQFDPGFFEQEVLPVFFDIPFSHAAAIRLVQLEEAIRENGTRLAVCYDAAGLASEASSCRLDVRRIPIRHRTGVFHPKNIFLLVEASAADENGNRPRSLIVSSASANLTRAGWWENVEVCHVEVIEAGGKTRLREDLLGFLRKLRAQMLSVEDRDVVNDIVAFLRETVPRQQRSQNEHLHTHFYWGQQPLSTFLQDVAGDWIRGAYLEVISPYFDDADACAPLRALVETLAPRQVRVFLPTNGSGDAQCREELYDDVSSIESCRWARLPKDLLRMGKGDQTVERFVHAKVYRFFNKSPKREVLFVGSANLTTPGHQDGGNQETGFLVETEPQRAPDFWLEVDQRRPRFSPTPPEDDAGILMGRSSLVIRYRWDQQRAEVFWDLRSKSPMLSLEAPQGVPLGRLLPIEGGNWTAVPTEVSTAIEHALAVTSFVHVNGEATTPRLVLVQEEGMTHKPSLLMSLSAADILRYWSLLTADQRSAFLEARAGELIGTGMGDDLVARSRVTTENNSLFDRFAGFFHAFACLRSAIETALVPAAGQRANPREAIHRLFGRKYDSLGNLLDRVFATDSSYEDVDRYVIALCARQLCEEVRQAHPNFWSEHPRDSRRLIKSLGRIAEVRERLVSRNGTDMAQFLDWFDPWFQKRATPLGESAK